jgi:splicing factor 45
MVGPGDVDDDLEVETKEECQKYGDVNKVVIFEVDHNKICVFFCFSKVQLFHRLIFQQSDAE